ncbi:hypothetical protein GQ42DRAFT_162821 [Ramicandelaber brevisporus]|nr:hypothetical protein GQ42DRAFT_162821 [Ramicandelaber brevisporus]
MALSDSLPATSRSADALSFVSSHLKNGAQVNAALIAYIKQRAAVEQEYAAQLSKLSQSIPAVSPSLLGGLAPVWDALAAESKAAASVHGRFSSTLSSDILPHLRDLPSTNSSWRALTQAEPQLARLLRDISDQQGKCTKAQRAVDSLSGSGSSSQRKMDSAVKKLNEATNELRDLESQWTASISSALSHLETIERARLSAIGRGFAKYSDSLQDALRSRMDIVDRSRTAIAGHNIDEDIAQFESNFNQKMGVSNVQSIQIRSRTGTNASRSTASVNGPRSPIATSAAVVNSNHVPGSPLSTIATSSASSINNVDSGNGNNNTSVQRRPKKATSGILSSIARRLSIMPSSPSAVPPLPVASHQSQHHIEHQSSLSKPASIDNITVENNEQIDHSASPQLRGSVSTNAIDAAFNSSVNNSKLEQTQQRIQFDIKEATSVNEDSQEQADALSRATDFLRSTQSSINNAAGASTTRRTTARRRTDIRSLYGAPPPPPPPPATAAAAENAQSETEIEGQSIPTTPISVNSMSSMNSTNTSTFFASLDGSSNVNNSGQPMVQARVTETLNAVCSLEGAERVQINGEIKLYMNNITADIANSTLVKLRLNGISGSLDHVAVNKAVATLVENEEHYDSDNDDSGSQIYSCKLFATGQSTDSSSSSSSSSSHVITILRYQSIVSDSNNNNSLIPLRLSAKWKCEPTTTSLIIGYEPNYTSTLVSQSSSSSSSSSSLENSNHEVTLQDLCFIAPHSEPISQVMSKPEGTWNANSRQMLWKRDPISLSNNQNQNQNQNQQQQNLILARFVTSQRSQPSPVAVRFTCNGSLFTSLNVDIQPALVDGHVADVSALECHQVTKRAITGKLMISPAVAPTPAGIPAQSTVSIASLATADVVSAANATTSSTSTSQEKTDKAAHHIQTDTAESQLN